MKKIISTLLAVVMLLSITAGLSLSAYADDERTVTLNAGAGTVDPTTVTLDENGNLPALPTPARTGWNFVGWYTAKVEENYWGDQEDEKVTDKEGVQAIKDKYGEYFADDSLNDAEWKEMFFTWIIVSDGTLVEEGDPLGSDITELYAMYEPTTITVKWHLNGWHKENTVALTATPQYGSPITALDFDETQYKCTIENEENKHKFEGWYDAAEGGTEWTFTGANGCSTNILTGDLDLYAHWSGGKETESIQITPATLSAKHPGESFTLNVTYSGIGDKEVNKPAITWSFDNAALELVSADDLSATFKVSESVDVIDSNKLLTVTATTADEEVSASKDITVRHIWGGETIIKDNCVEMVKSYTCSYEGCNAVRTVSVPNYGEHTVVTDEAVAATCTAEGKTEGSHCSVCGEIIVPQETVEMLPHTFGEWEVKDGEKTRTCTVCGETETEPADAEDPDPEAPSAGETTVSATSAKYVIGSGSGVSIQLSTSIENLTAVYVNGEKVDEANYTLSEDGTVLTFTSEYLDTLSAGEYEVTLLSDSGTVATTLTVEKADDDTATQTPADDETTTQAPADETEETAEQNKADKNASSASPSTGAQKGGLALAAIALAGGVAMIIKKKEQE